MADEVKEKTKKDRGCNCNGGACNAVYGLGLIGAAVYYIQHATNFTEGLMGLLKAIVWPALLIHKGLTLLGM